MKDFNSQILGAWDDAKFSEHVETTRDVIEQSMSFLKFGYPVRNIEELEEVAKLCLFYHEAILGPRSILKEFRQAPRNLDVSLSLTDRCGNQCCHCSTDATLSREKASVPFDRLDRALNQMSGHVKSLAISCEGDPFYYQSSTVRGHEACAKKDIIDVANLLMKYDFECVLIQSMAPDSRRLQLLRDVLKVIDKKRKPNLKFLPQISFNLYTPRAGLRRRFRAQKKGSRYELYVPGSEDLKSSSSLVEVLKRTSSSAKANVNFERESFQEPLELRKVSEHLRQYADDVKLAILEYAQRGYKVHFEIRSDTFGGITNMTNTEAVLERILEELSIEHPEIAFRKCSSCSRIHVDMKSTFIIPIGRAVSLFPNGKEEEEKFFDSHVKMNPYKYLCDNWLSWGSMIFDTKGFPQLCYSNVALTPRARTREGPNLYDDGFERMCEFYIRVWKDRITFLKGNLHKLIKSRPNECYCPLDLFKKTLEDFT